jgi:SpoVK/Ycf46/Vps4 family AAA+-type ATPase
MGSSGVSDSGTTARVFATFLTWMQEKTKPVFLIATANDVAALPPELLRKGRFDEIFFVDLPELEDRKEIIKIHLKKRNRDPRKFKVPQLAEMTQGYSGAELEQVVIGALNHAFFDDRELKFEDLKEEAENQVPLSRMMAEEISELRQWAVLRARPSANRKGEF